MKTLKALAIGLGLVWSSLFGHAPAQYSATVSQLPTIVANYQDSLAVQENTGDTSFTLVSGVDSLSRSLSGFYCFTVDPNTSIAEYECGTASGTAISAVTRGVDPVNPNATSSVLITAHRRGAAVVISDYTPIASLNRILQGIDTLPSGTVLQYNANVTNAQVSANGENLVNENLLASTSFAGVSNGTYANKGIFQEATRANVASGTTVGSSGANLVIGVGETATSSQASTTVVVTNTSGQIDQSFLSGTTTPYTINTTTTLNNVLKLVASTATSTATSTDIFNLLPAGIMAPYAVSSTAPAGWLMCDGTIYSSSTYPRLYQVLQQTYGGSSSTGTFAVPNTKGNFITGAGGQFGGVGATGGAATSSVSGSITTSNVGATGGPSGFAGAGTYGLNNGLATTTPPYIVENFIIKY